MTGFKTERRRLKPMMERKRRARINRSLEQLKDVIVDSNGGILPRLDKARILELTVEYLQKKTLRGHAGTGDERFKAGYIRCANEVTSFLHDKVDDGKLSQIIQYLFTLTATLKRHTERTPPITHTRGCTTVSGKLQGVNSHLATSPDIMIANAPIREVKVFHSRKQIKSTVNPSPSFINQSSEIFGSNEAPCDSKSNHIPISCQRRKPVNEDLLPKPAIPSAYMPVNRHISHTMIHGCSRLEADDMSRSRRNGSLSSSTASGPSIDVDSSSDDEVFIRRHDRLLQPEVAIKWMDADDNETGRSELSDSDDDSNTSDVFNMDCQSASDTERVSSPKINLNNNNNNINNNNDVIVHKQANARQPFGIHDNRQESLGSMWRPW